MYTKNGRHYYEKSDKVRLSKRQTYSDQESLQHMFEAIPDYPGLRHQDDPGEPCLSCRRWASLGELQGDRYDITCGRCAVTGAQTSPQFRGCPAHTERGGQL